MNHKSFAAFGAALLLSLGPCAMPAVAATSTQAAIGTSLPDDFPVIVNPYLGVPVLGFGAPGRAERVPVIFLRGNNDTPFPTACNPFGYIRNIAQYMLASGYRPSELWGLGYQGDQCDLTEITRKSGVSHSTAAAVPLPCCAKRRTCA